MSIYRCPDCGIEKPESDFHKNVARSRGLDSICIECKRRRASVRHHANYEENKNRNNQKALLKRRKLRKDIIQAYGGKCVCCGEAEEAFLVIDHIDGGGTKERREPGKGGVAFYWFLKTNCFPEGYQVLCANCNMAKERLEGCPHQK